MAHKILVVTHAKAGDKYYARAYDSDSDDASPVLESPAFDTRAEARLYAQGMAKAASFHYMRPRVVEE